MGLFGAPGVFKFFLLIADFRTNTPYTDPFCHLPMLFPQSFGGATSWGEQLLHPNTEIIAYFLLVGPDDNHNTRTMCVGTNAFRPQSAIRDSHRQ